MESMSYGIQFYTIEAGIQFYTIEAEMQGIIAKRDGK